MHSHRFSSRFTNRHTNNLNINAKFGESYYDSYESCWPFSTIYNSSGSRPTRPLPSIEGKWMDKRYTMNLEIYCSTLITPVSETYNSEGLKHPSRSSGSGVTETARSILHSIFQSYSTHVKTIIDLNNNVRIIFSVSLRCYKLHSG